ncbi:MAG: alanine--tRNA ligase [Minisyncoccia bacterium]
MNSNDIINIFFDFFQKRGHKIIPSSSLIAPNPSTLFTTAGMQQLNSYLLGEKDVIKDFRTRHLVSCQKCFRANDINEVGDERHHTFFEMLGNWSIGQDKNGNYFKEGAIKYALEFLVDTLKLDKNKIQVTIFKGEGELPRDEESLKIWQKNGISLPKIKEFGMSDNFWGPVYQTGPCGPCTEIYYDRGEEFGCKKKSCGPNCEYCNRYLEIWNLVFMEYEKKEDNSFTFLKQKNVDTGIGLERLTSIIEKKETAYETELFFPAILEIEKYSNLKYQEAKRNFRIIADHLRAIVFLVSEGILPSNVSHGYILRFLIRRIARIEILLNLKEGWEKLPVKYFVDFYGKRYPELIDKDKKIISIIYEEKNKFKKTLEKGLKEFENQCKKFEKEKIIPGKIVFYLYQSFGFPIELLKELARENNFIIKEDEFWEEFKKHKEISKIGSEKKFGGVGIELAKNEKEKEVLTKYHTATHLLHSALRKILDLTVKQAGSDIKPERLRFDFFYDKKITDNEIKKIEDLVNQKIKENLIVKKEIMPLEEAIKTGALAFFKEKYPETVSVYTILNEKTGEVFSKEICAGPHVKETGILGIFKIQKVESIGKNTKRIKAILINN